MALTVAQQNAIHAAVERYIDALGAVSDNQAAAPALTAARSNLRACLLGGFDIYIDDAKFWCFLDEITMYIFAGTRATSLLLAQQGNLASGKDLADILKGMRKELG